MASEWVTGNVILVDLDGTLAEQVPGAWDHCTREDWWNGDVPIGKPIPLMVSRVQDWIYEGYTVKIFTARYCEGNLAEIACKIQDWTEIHIGHRLEVTNVKDFNAVAIWDDRAVGVVRNTGERK